MIESQLGYVEDALRTMDAEGLVTLETTPQAQEAYRQLIAEKSAGTVWLGGGCASWYLDPHGHNTTLWPDFTFRFRRMLKQLDRENYVGTRPDGTQVTPAVAA
jgi:cyclohexanone monooxygenase